MPNELESAIVRIFGPNKKPLGAGFHLGEGRIITCTHVIDAALGRPKAKWNTKPIGEILLDFPFLRSESEGAISARVVDWRPHDKDDITRLNLAEHTPLGAGSLTLAQESELAGHEISACGFTPDRPDGIWANGTLSGMGYRGWIQIDGASTINYSIVPGFSGGPVWSNSLKAVVGIVAAAELRPELKVSYMIPAKIVATMVPSTNTSRGSNAYFLTNWFRRELLRSLLDDLVEREKLGLGEHCKKVREALGKLVNAAGDSELSGSFSRAQIYPELEKLERLYIEWNEHEDKKLPDADAQRRNSLNKMRACRKKIAQKISTYQGVLSQECDQAFFRRICEVFSEICRNNSGIFPNLTRAVNNFTDGR